MLHALCWSFPVLFSHSKEKTLLNLYGTSQCRFRTDGETRGKYQGVRSLVSVQSTYRIITESVDGSSISIKIRAHLCLGGGLRLRLGIGNFLVQD